MQHIQKYPSIKRYIFVDLNMPEKSGWDFLDEYQMLETEKNSPVIILSSSIDFAEKKRSIDYNIVLNFFTKPLTKRLLETLA